MPCSVPRWTGQVLVGFFPAARPPPVNRRVGIHNFTFEACLSFTRVTACKVAARPTADSCPEASVRPVAQPNRPVATMSYRQLHGWNLLPLTICALGARCYPQGQRVCKTCFRLAGRLSKTALVVNTPAF